MRAAIALDRLDDAAGWAELMAELAPATRLPATHARGLQARAEVQLARGDAAGAAATALRAVAGAIADDVPQEEIGARILAGRALLADGRREAGLDELQRATAGAGRAGALALRDAAARELRRAGGRVSTETRRAGDATGRTPLTEREQAIADLVAHGRSNKQVAATLFVSEKTVEANLTRIYAKLGVRSRTELASLARRSSH